MSIQKDVMKEVLKERQRQDRKWGEQNHEPFKWLAILGEEVGEVNNAALESYDWVNNKFKEDLDHYREELIQVAAVAVSMVECIDRNKKK